jgi:hypothetical protein
MEATQRKALAKGLEELQASQRATAKALGVSPQTINNDLRVKNLTHEESDPELVTHESRSEPSASVNNLTLSAPWNSGFPETRQELVRQAETRLRRAEKDTEREEKRKANEAPITETERPPGPSILRAFHHQAHPGLLLEGECGTRSFSIVLERPLRNNTILLYLVTDTDNVIYMI